MGIEVKNTILVFIGFDFVAFAYRICDGIKNELISALFSVELVSSKITTYDVIAIGALKQISHHPYLERFINGISQSFYTTYYNILIEIDYSYISSFTHHQPVVAEIDPPASNIVDQLEGSYYTDAF